MKVSGINGKEKGGVTIPLFHCIFNGDESVTHFMREYDVSLYQTLPYLYAVCIARTVNKTKTVLGGFFVKTSYTHNDPDFVDALHLVVEDVPALQALMGETTSFLPACITLAGEDKPPTEAEMLRIMIGQYLKFSD